MKVDEIRQSLQESDGLDVMAKPSGILTLLANKSFCQTLASIMGASIIGKSSSLRHKVMASALVALDANLNFAR